jgi:Kdo2-lipid IVA lauroyltransferase/acyltransferase
VAAHHRRGPRARDADDKGAPLSFGYANKSGWIVGFRRVLHQASQLSEAAVVLAVMMTFACLPIDWASALGGYIGRLIGPRLGVSRRALGNLRRAMPENSDGENRRILCGMWDNLGRSVAEYPHLGRICGEECHRVEIVNVAAVQELLSAGRPVIVFGGHFANWEIGPTTIHRLMGPSLLSVYRAANNRWVDGLLRRRLRARCAVAKGAAGGRDLLRHLRCGGHVAMLVDQKQNDGIAVPFFGRDAMTAPAIARIGLRFGCPLLPIAVERLSGAQFRVTVMPALNLAATGNVALDVLAAMTRVNVLIEDWIRARPEQWLWVHRRWPQ